MSRRYDDALVSTLKPTVPPWSTLMSVAKPWMLASPGAADAPGALGGAGLGVLARHRADDGGVAGGRDRGRGRGPGGQAGQDERQQQHQDARALRAPMGVRHVHHSYPPGLVDLDYPDSCSARGGCHDRIWGHRRAVGCDGPIRSDAMTPMRFRGPVLPDGEVRDLYVVGDTVTYEPQPGADTGGRGLDRARSRRRPLPHRPRRPRSGLRRRRRGSRRSRTGTPAPC